MKSRGIAAVSTVGTYILFAKFSRAFPSVKNVAVFASEVDREAITFVIARRDKNLHRSVMRSEVGRATLDVYVRKSVAFYHYDVGFRDH